MEKSKKLTTNEIIDQLEELEEADDSDRDPDYMNEEEMSSSSSEEGEGDTVDKATANKRQRKEEEIRIYMHPPEERADGDTDKDSDDSDEPEGLVRHLPRRLLRGTAEKRRRKRAPLGDRLTADSDDEDDGEVQPQEGQWTRKDQGFLGTKVPPFIKPVLSAADTDILETAKTAYDYYKLFQPDEYVDEIIYQSKLYGVQRNFGKSMELVSSNTYR